MKKTIPLLLLLAAIGCHTVVYDGKMNEEIVQNSTNTSNVRIFLAPFNNATEDEHASRALTEVTATMLIERHIPVIQTESLLLKSRAETAAGPDGLYVEAAQTAKANYLLVGTVHEYRYKTDLDGDPAIGVTMRIVDAKTGLTIWQGSTAAVHGFFSSLSTASEYAMRRLVARIPIHDLESKIQEPSRPSETPEPRDTSPKPADKITPSSLDRGAHWQRS